MEGWISERLDVHGESLEQAIRNEFADLKNYLRNACIGRDRKGRKRRRKEVEEGRYEEPQLQQEPEMQQEEGRHEEPQLQQEPEMQQEVDRTKSLFLETAEENAEHFFTLLSSHPTIEQFLSREIPILVRSVSIPVREQDEQLRFHTDLDGAVIELKGLRGLCLKFRHVTFIRQNKLNIKYVSPMLKKHLNLQRFSRKAMENFPSCLGFQLLYEGGWECYYALTPKEDDPHDYMSPNTIRVLSEEHFFKLRKEFRSKLREAACNKTALNTLAKNDLISGEKLTILPDDCGAILNILQDAIDAIDSPGGLRKCIFLFRFGEKSTEPLSLKDFNISEIQEMTVHVACNITAPDDMDILWSRYGIQDVIGNRGNVTTCLSFLECGNFQTNLDGRSIDISAELRSVSKFPDRIRFLQLYADLPHLRPEGKRHPISGLICCGGVVHPNTTDALERDTKKYLSTLSSNFILMRRAVCRIELVLHLPDIPQLVDAKDFINIGSLQDMLQKTPLIVPFHRDPSGKSMLEKMRDIGTHLIRALSDSLSAYKATGNKVATWKSLQAEVALEKLIWGHPLDVRAQRLSVALGPGTSYPSKCKTDVLGFLALEPLGQFIDRGDVPPINIWTQSQLLQERVKRWVGFHDILEKSKPEIGKHTVLYLLQDLHAVAKMLVPFGNFLISLKDASSHPGIAGSITVEQLAEALAAKRNIAFPMIFGKVLALLREKDHNAEELLREGILDLQLQYFPAVQLRDTHRNDVLVWKKNLKFWTIVGMEKLLKDTIHAAVAFSQIVKTELEKRGLIFSSKLKLAKCPFPWIAPTVRKLHGKKLSHQDMISTLTFVSCIAFIMDGWFVDYNKLSDLEQSLPVKQPGLRILEILARYPLNQNPKFYRLHKTIPKEIAIDKPEGQKKEEPPGVQKKDNDPPVLVPDEPIQEELEDFQPQDVSLFRPTTLPANVNYRWTREELEILYEIKLTTATLPTVKGIYQEYVKLCWSRNIPNRAYPSFERKFKRLGDS